MWKNLVAALCLVIAVSGDISKEFDKRSKIASAVHDKRFEEYQIGINAKFQLRLRPDVKPSLFEPSEEDLDFGRSSIDLNNKIDSLVDKDSQDAHERMKAEKLMGFAAKMKAGVGGMTIVSHRPSGKAFLMRNNQTFICTGRINDNGDCSDILKSFQVTESNPRSDWCFLRSYHVINNLACLCNVAVSLNVTNGRTTCISQPNFTSISLDEYKKLCSSVSESVEYRYIPEENDPDHVVIPNKNRYFKCDNQRNYYSFHEKNELLYRNGDFHKFGEQIHGIVAVQNKSVESPVDRINAQVQQQVDLNDTPREHDVLGDKVSQLNVSERLEPSVTAAIGHFHRFGEQIHGTVAVQNKSVESPAGSINAQVQQVQVDLNNTPREHDVPGDKVSQLNVSEPFEPSVTAAIGKQHHESASSGGKGTSLKNKGSVAYLYVLSVLCVVFTIKSFLIVDSIIEYGINKIVYK